MLMSPQFAEIKPANLPMPPDAVLRVIEACSDPQVTDHKLSCLVSADPRLTAELLRVVNSAYFGRYQELKTIPQAVVVVGRRTLRYLVLCISIRDALRGRTIPGFDAGHFIDDALRRAVSARLLGETQKLDADECFTLGLLQGFGMLVMFYLRPENAGRWPELRGADPDDRYRLEREYFGTTHDVAARLVAQAWCLPEELMTALPSHHLSLTKIVPGEHTVLSVVTHAADWLAAVFSASDKAAALEGCKAFLADTLRIDAEGCETLLEQVAESVNEAAQGLSMGVKEPIRLVDIMRAVNLRLVEDNLSYQELTWLLQQSLAERDRLATELQRELELAREIQQSLLPPPSLGPVTGINMPAGQVSGDFYDYFVLEGGCVYFAVADVSGKGMNAALLMAKTSSLFRCLGKSIRDPSRLLATINAELCETSIRGMFVTMVAGIYDPKADDIRLVNAGNPAPLYLSRSGRYAELPATAPPLGIVSDSEFLETKLRLQGGSLYLFTDGLTESEHSHTGTPDTSRLVKILLELRHLPPNSRLWSTVRALHPPNETPIDDITLMMVGAESVC